MFIIKFKDGTQAAVREIYNDWNKYSIKFYLNGNPVGCLIEDIEYTYKHVSRL